MIKNFLLASSIIASTSLMAMHTGEINLNNDDIEAKVSLDIGQFEQSIPVDRIFAGAKITYASDVNAEFPVVNPKFEMFSKVYIPTELRGLKFGVGAKIVYTETDKVMNEKLSFMAVPLTIEAKYELPSIENIPKLTISTEFAISPQILSFMDADHYLENETYIGIEATRLVNVKLGYRYIETNYDVGDLEYNQAAYAGVEIKF